MIEYLSHYIGEFSLSNFYKLVDDIFELTQVIGDNYTNYKAWFYDKQIMGVLQGNREIIFVKSNDSKKIIAVSCLKKTQDEKKICTLYVDKKYRSKGIGSSLLEEAFEYLDTTKPLITFSYDKINMFDSIVKKYDWKLTDIVEKDNLGYELIFNSNINKYCGKSFKKQL